MKILIYSRPFAPMVGGVETYVMWVAKGLSNGCDSGQVNRVQVTVATEAVASEFDDSSLPFHVVRQPGFLELFRLIRESDIVHLAGPCFLPMVFAWLLRKPFIVEQHAYQVVCPNGLLFFEPTKTICPGHFMAGRHRRCWECNRGVGRLPAFRMWLLTFLRRWLCNKAKTNVAISHHVQKRLELQRSRVIYYGIPDQGHPGDSQKPLAPPLFAYVGRLVSEKGLDTLLDAAKMLKDDGLKFCLKIIGDGPECEHLRRRATEELLGPYIDFTGFVVGEELHRVMNDVSVVIMPSRWEETAGLSAIEHMMRGRLVICSDLGGLGEVVDGAGLKFSGQGAGALAALMRSVLKNPELVQGLGRKARERALALFSLEGMIEEHKKLYQEIVTQRLVGRESEPEF